MFIIYKITHLPTSAAYIGQTRHNHISRFEEHLRDALAGRVDSRLHELLVMEPREAFEVVELCRCDTPYEATEREYALVVSEKTYEPFGMNVRLPRLLRPKDYGYARKVERRRSRRNRRNSINSLWPV